MNRERIQLMDASRLFERIKRLATLVPYHLLPPGRALSPLQVIFVVTLACNLKCRGCFIELAEEKNNKAEASDKPLTIEEIKSLIDQTPWYSVLTFTGGEPLIRKDWLEILKYAAARRRCHLITNGTRIGAEEAAALVDLRARHIFGRGLLAIGISVNGLNEVHDHITRRPGSFEKTIEAFRMICRYKNERKARFPFLDLKTVIREESIHQLSEICLLGGELGVDIVSLQLLYRNKLSHYKRDRVSLASDSGEQQPHTAPVFERASLDVLEKELVKIEKMKKEVPFSLRFLPEIPVSKIAEYYMGQFDSSQFRCFAPWNIMIMTETGYVTPCLDIYQSANARQNTLKQCWNSPGMRKIRMDLREKGVGPRCAGCCLLEYKQ